MARIDASTGKPLNAVFAARIRMIPVTIEMKMTPDVEVGEDGLGQLADDRVLRVGGADRLASQGQLGPRVLRELDPGQPHEA